MEAAQLLELPDAMQTGGGAGARLKTLIHTREPDEATAFLGSLYGGHALQVQRDKGMELNMRGFDFEGLHVGVIRYGSPAVASLDAPRPLWVFSYLHRGSVSRGGAGPASQPGDAGVNAPDDMRAVHMSSDMELVNLRVLDADMREACRSMLGSELSHPLRFDTDAPAGTPQAGSMAW